jgi:hypothetical protein
MVGGLRLEAEQFLYLASKLKRKRSSSGAILLRSEATPRSAATTPASDIPHPIRDRRFSSLT